MSRIDDFLEMLDSYEEREPNKDNKDMPELLTVDDLRGMLSTGCEDNYKAGLLVGKISDSGRFLSIFDVVVPVQESALSITVVNEKGWNDAVHEAKSIGEIIGFVVYVGKAKPSFTDATRKMHRRLCKKYGFRDFIMAINYKNDTISELDINCEK